MTTHISCFKKAKAFRFLLFILIGVLAPFFTFAQFAPGETLDPGCLPGETGCTVSWIFLEQPVGEGLETGASVIPGGLLYSNQSDEVPPVNRLYQHQDLFFQDGKLVVPELFIGSSENGYSLPMSRGGSSQYLGVDSGGNLEWQTLDTTEPTRIIAGSGDTFIDTQITTEEEMVIDEETGETETVTNTQELLLFNTDGEERMRITESGNIGVGGISDPSEMLHVNGNILSQGIMTFSDKRLKENVVELEKKTELEKLLGLRSVKYNWKKGSGDSNVHYGFIAQEVEEIYPDIVQTYGDTKAVAYSELISPIISAIQQQQEQIDYLNREFAAFSNKDLTE